MGDLADADVTEVTREHITRFRNEEGFPRDNRHARVREASDKWLPMHGAV